MQTKIATIRKFIMLSLILSASHHYLQAQGCSDAGFCTLGSLKLQDKDSLAHQQLTLLLPVGIGDEETLVFTPGIQYDRQLGESWSVQVKLLANYANGSLGTTIGLGDLYLAGTRTLGNSSKWKTDVTLGFKIPLNDGNLRENELSLPMVYQSSLGTFDVIGGLSVSNARWQLAAGWQQPLTKNNNNEFLPAEWADPDAANFEPTRNFERKADALLRVAYKENISKKFSLTGGLLGIYHIQNDRYRYPITDEQISIKGSEGLTLNITVLASWNLSDRTSINLTIGSPLIARDSRPDGLTRSFVFAPEIKWKF